MHPTLHKRTRRAQAWAITLADSITKRITDGEQIPFLLPIQLPEGQNRRVMQETMKARKERAAERGPEWSWALRPLPLESFIQKEEGPARLYTIQVCHPGEERATRKVGQITQAILDTIPPEPDQLPVSSSDKDENLLSSIYGI
jgi:hypothetical protein